MIWNPDFSLFFQQLLAPSGVEKYRFSTMFFPKISKYRAENFHFLSTDKYYASPLTLNQDILSVVKGYTISFIKITFEQKIPNFTRMHKKQIVLVDLELKQILKKEVTKRTQPAEGEILSNLFLVGKNTEVIAL